MSSLIHADIFFFVTTIAVVIVVALLIVVIVYIIKILNDLRYISRVARTQTDLLAADIAEIRAKIKSEGALGGFISMIMRLFTGRGKRSSDKPKQKQRNEAK